MFFYPQRIENHSCVRKRRSAQCQSSPLYLCDIPNLVSVMNITCAACVS